MSKEIKMEVQYEDFVPDNVMDALERLMAENQFSDIRREPSRLIIDAGKYPEIGMCAEIAIKRLDCKLEIKVTSPDYHAPWMLLQKIRACLTVINRSLSLGTEEYLCIGEEAVKVDHLLRLRLRGKTIYEGDYADYEIDAVLTEAFGSPQVRKMKQVESIEEMRDCLLR